MHETIQRPFLWLPLAHISTHSLKTPSFRTQTELSLDPQHRANTEWETRPLLRFRNSISLAYQFVVFLFLRRTSCLRAGLPILSYFIMIAFVYIMSVSIQPNVIQRVFVCVCVTVKIFVNHCMSDFILHYLFTSL